MPLVCLVGALQGSEVRESVTGATPSAAQGSPAPVPTETGAGPGAGATEAPQGSALGGVTAKGERRRGRGLTHRQGNNSRDDTVIQRGGDGGRGDCTDIHVHHRQPQIVKAYIILYTTFLQHLSFHNLIF